MNTRCLGNGCLEFDACNAQTANCENLLSQSANVGKLECQVFSAGIACITGTANGVTGDWQVTQSPLGPNNDFGVSSYCSTPGNCEIILSNMAFLGFPDWVLAYQPDPTITYVAPDIGSNLLYTDPAYMRVTRVCCGSCAECNGPDAVCSNNPLIFAAADAAAQFSEQVAEKGPLRRV